MVLEEGGAVIDQPDGVVPAQHVRVADGAVDIGDQGVEPDDIGGEFRSDRVGFRLVEREGAGQEIEAEVAPGAFREEIAHFVVRLALGEGGGDIDDDEFRHVEAERAADLATDEFGNEGFQALSGAAELHHVETVVTCLDDAGQRAALAQGRDIARSRDRSNQGSAHIVLSRAVA
jgi:hypothetical protein